MNIIKIAKLCRNIQKIKIWIILRKYNFLFMIGVKFMKWNEEKRKGSCVRSCISLQHLHWIRYFFLMILLWTGILSFFSVKAFANDSVSDDKTVKVGYYLSHNFQEGNSDNSFKTGYSYEYLQKIASYTSWHYEYIYGDWDELYEKLASGEIDLMAGISYSDDRSDLISYPDYEMLNETFYIYKDTDDTSVKSGDIASYTGKKIGTLKEKRAMTASLEEWKEKMLADIEIIYFDTLDSCASAFNEKEIDAFVSADNIVSSYSGIVPIEKIGKEPYYLCVTKNRTDILEELNMALSVINEQDSLDLDTLRNKYFTESTVSTFLSSQEREWMEQHPSVTVGYVTSYLPYCDTDEKGNATGLIADIVPDLFDALPGNYSPEIIYHSFDSQTDMLESLENGELDFVFPVSNERWYSEQHNYQQSTAIIASPISLVYKESYTSTTTEKISVNKKNLLQYCYTVMNYPDAELVMCNTIDDCVNAIKQGRANCTLLSALRAGSLVGREKSLNTITLPNDEKLCFGVIHGDSALLQLLNHGLNILGDSYGLSHSYQYINKLITYTPLDFIKDNVWIFTILLLLLLLVMILYFIQCEETQRKIAEKEAMQKKTLEEALNTSQQAAVARRVFLRNMSHDIRTPMNAVIGFTNLAIQTDNDPGKVQEYLSKILISSKHLLGIVNNVLEISRIESGQMDLEETQCNLLDIVNETDVIIRTQAQNRNQIFTIDVSQLQDSIVFCDKLRVKEILVNLLGNAVKYTPRGGTISLTVQQLPCSYEALGNYEIRVKDNGCGMSTEFLKKVFLPFERQSDSTKSGIQGTGLGMSITKGFVDMMNGTIDVLSEENKGTEFIVRLQFRLADPSAANSSPEKTGTSCASSVSSIEKVENFNDTELSSHNELHFAGKRLLLVEDNELNREIAATVLAEAGFKVDIAENGAIAVIKIADSPAGYFDAVLMDIQMPVMDGYTATRQIRLLKEHGGDTVPVIALSANAFEEDKKASFEAGMNGHLAKPINVIELLETLSILLCN